MFGRGSYISFKGSSPRRQRRCGAGGGRYSGSLGFEGIARFKREPDLGKRVIKKMLRLDDESLAQESWELFAKHRLAAPYPNIKGLKTSYEYVAETRPDVWKHKPEEFVDASFVEELDKSGFIKSLYEK